MPAINPKRLLDDLYALRGIGTYKTGVHRPTFSADDVRARQWLTERMTEAGLDAQIDGIGNVLGFSRAPGRKILAGSHIESQNDAGWLDGPLGVIYALEAARALGEDPATGDAGVDVVAFCDEEGHFGVFLGSRSFVGEVTEADIDNARDRTRGTPMREALAAAGYAGRPRLGIDSARYVGYLEAHIEQGRALETANNKIGVVTGLVGLWNYRITAEGQQNHAGTTMMWERARCRSRLGAAGGDDRPALRRPQGRAHGVDVRQHAVRAGRAEHHPGTRTRHPAIPRRRSRRAASGWRRRCSNSPIKPAAPGPARSRSPAPGAPSRRRWMRAWRRRSKMRRHITRPGRAVRMPVQRRT